MVREGMLRAFARPIAKHPAGPKRKRMTKRLLVNLILFPLVVVSLLVGSVALSLDIKPVAAEEAHTVKAGVDQRALEDNNERKLAKTSDGHLHLVYSRQDESGVFQIYHAESADGGNTWMEEPATGSERNQCFPSLVDKFCTDGSVGVNGVPVDRVHIPETSPNWYTIRCNHDQLRWTSRRMVEAILNDQPVPSLNIYSITPGSPIEVCVIDSQGRRTGSIQGQVVEEIPDSNYDAATG